MSTQHCTGNSSHCNKVETNKQTKALKGLKIRIEEIKLFLFAADIIIYIKNPRKPTKQPLELISELSKVTGYKVNIPKLIIFLYKQGQRVGKEKKVLFRTALKTNKKPLGIT